MTFTVLPPSHRQLGDSPSVSYDLDADAQRRIAREVAREMMPSLYRDDEDDEFREQLERSAFRP